jgi:hypothetical protein
VGILQIFTKEGIVKYVLIALVLGFFFIPLVTFFGDYYRPCFPKNAASILFIFLR